MSHKPDRPWQEVIMERYKRKGNPKLGPLQVMVALPFVGAMDAAAKKEGITRASFIRRSVAVQIQRVLGGSIHDYLQHCPSLKPYGVKGGGGFAKDEQDFGFGIEHWCPHPGCDGTHLK